MLKKIAAGLGLVIGLIVWEVTAGLEKIDDAVRSIGKS